MTDTNNTNQTPPLQLPPALQGGAGLYVTGEDNLQIASFNSASGVVLDIRVRFVSTRGLVTPLTFQSTPNTNRTVKLEQFGLGEGFIANVEVFASSGAPLVGQCFVMLRVVRGLLGDIRELATLAQGFVTASQRLAGPGATMQWTTQRPGFIRSITGTNPAAGAEWSETVPTGARWRLLALRSRIVTSGVAAVRFPKLTIDDGSAVLYESDPGGSINASVTVSFVTGGGVQRATAIEAIQQWSLPVKTTLLAGSRIRSVTTNLDAGDDWTAPQLLIEEWLEGA